jgi:hypothetical protein
MLEVSGTSGHYRPHTVLAYTHPVPDPHNLVHYHGVAPLVLSLAADIALAIDAVEPIRAHMAHVVLAVGLAADIVLALAHAADTALASIFVADVELVPVRDADTKLMQVHMADTELAVVLAAYAGLERALVPDAEVVPEPTPAADIALTLVPAVEVELVSVLAVRHPLLVGRLHEQHSPADHFFLVQSQVSLLSAPHFLALQPYCRYLYRRRSPVLRLHEGLTAVQQMLDHLFEAVCSFSLM